MAKVTLRLPSKVVQYGYVEVEGTPEEFGFGAHELSDPQGIGILYTNYVAAFLRGEREGVDAITGSLKPEPDPTPRTVSQVMSDEDVDTEAEARAIVERESSMKAAQAVVHGTPEEAERLIVEYLGGTKVSEEYAVGDKVTVGGIEFTKHSAAPWEQPPVDAKPKPWETGGTKPKLDFDFS